MTRSHQSLTAAPRAIAVALLAFALSVYTVPESLVKVCTDRETGTEPRRLRAWLCQVVRHTVLDHSRGRRPAEPVTGHLFPADADGEARPLSALGWLMTSGTGTPIGMRTERRPAPRYD